MCMYIWNYICACIYETYKTVYVNNIYIYIYTEYIYIIFKYSLYAKRNRQISIQKICSSQKRRRSPGAVIGAQKNNNKRTRRVDQSAVRNENGLWALLLLLLLLKNENENSLYVNFNGWSPKGIHGIVYSILSYKAGTSWCTTFECVQKNSNKRTRRLSNK